MREKLVLASTNKGKRREIAALVEPLGFDLVTAAELGFSEEIAETGQSFAENARIKARAVAQALERPAIADDSGLEVEALGGAPGILSARYAGPGATDQENYQKLLKALEGVPLKSRSAAFVCVMACCQIDGKTLLAEGRLKGRIAQKTNRKWRLWLRSCVRVAKAGPDRGPTGPGREKRHQPQGAGAWQTGGRA